PYKTTQVTGAAWVVLKPNVSTGNSVTASLVNQGVVSSSQSLLYPSIAVAANGMGFMNFAVAGDLTYPSPGYVTFSGAQGVTGPIHLARRGTAPLDDFTCYTGLGFGPACRYGDYSMGQAFGSPRRTRIYMATEYVGPVARDSNTNWDTYVYSAPRP
ncbi:MAG: hypothetical protein ACRDPG_09520, partial [Nocardioidaceae bacterium]